MVEGVLIDEAIEVLCQCTGDFGRATGARAIHQALGPLVGKAMDPFAQGRIGKVQRVRDRLEALPFDDVAHGLGTTEDAGLLGLLEKVSKVGRASSGKWSLRVRIEGSPGKNYYKNIILRHIDMVTSYRNKTFPTQIFRKLLCTISSLACLSTAMPLDCRSKRSHLHI